MSLKTATAIAIACVLFHLIFTVLWLIGEDVWIGGVLRLGGHVAILVSQIVLTAGLILFLAVLLIKQKGGHDEHTA
jgi:hypothetical protein